MLRGIDLDVAEGEIVSVLGANGVGKTTTLRAISGIIPGWTGSIEFEGHRFTNEVPEKRAARGIGHVPEGRGILTSLTVGQNLELGTTLRTDSSKEIQRDHDRLLDLFNPLAGRLNEPASQLSGGQQQMLAVARALIARPRLMMIDELSFGLAPLLVDELFGLIRELRNEGTTFLLVEQHAGAVAISDRVYVVSGGRTIIESAADQLDTASLVRSYLGDAAADSQVSTANNTSTNKQGDQI
ncbi:ABC transporter ATP-binding protein [Ilumatobacter sp.]|uniref:ABC transporter ATP-binding protein n=1 Tax=Ilumatobacter sp. TaxID=1967498 RepID=UPI003750665C